MKRKQKQFIVTIDIPASMDQEDMKDYIYDAVGWWRGQYFQGDDNDPPDPRWEINPNSLTVKVR